MNLLSSARSYRDQVKRSVSGYFRSDNPKKKVVEALFSAENDRHVEYRIAEELRDHAQHRSLPVHAVYWHSSWEEMDLEVRRLRFYVVPSFSVEQLIDEGGFDEERLTELKASGKEMWPLTPLLRRYVECFTRVHEAVRGLLRDQLEADHRTIERALERAKAEVNPTVTGLL
jgi:hypothetical protein